MSMLMIVRGLPGSGKSTFAKRALTAGTVGSHYEADMFFETESGYVYQPEKIKEAHEWCFESVKRDLTAGLSVAVSNTFTRVWEFQKYLDLAKELDARVVLVEATGEFANVHGVPQEAIDRMRERWEPYTVGQDETMIYKVWYF